MIPSIEDIVAGLINGTVDAGRAKKWLEQHIELAEQSALGQVRDDIAVAAMQGILASGHQEAIEKLTIQAEGNAPKGVALAAYGFADAMLKVRATS